MTHRSYSLCQLASSGQDGASKNIYMTSTTKTKKREKQHENNNKDSYRILNWSIRQYLY